MVQELFGFLKEQAFIYSCNDKYCIARFDSPEVFVSVSYDANNSHELSVGIGLQADISNSTESSFTISQMLRVANHSDLGEAAVLIQASNDDKARSKLEWLASLLEEHGTGFLNGDRDLFEALNNQGNEDCRAFALRTELDNAVQKAAKAWQQKKYDEVVMQLEPLLEHLPKSEQKRLEIARTRSKIV